MRGLVTMGAPLRMGGRWTPSQLGTLLVWWRSDQGTYQDAAMSTPANADSEAVRGWRDLSGNEHHATTETRPAAIHIDSRSQPAVRGDDSTTGLQTAAGAAGTIAAAHIFLVGNSFSSGSVNDTWIGASSGSYGGATSKYLLMQNYGGHHNWQVYRNGVPRSLWRGGGSTFTEIVEIKYSGGNEIAISYNGGKWTAISTGIFSALELTAEIDLMCYDHNGTINGSKSGDLYGVVWSNAILSDEDRARMLAYLAARHALTIDTDDCLVTAMEASTTYYDAFPRLFVFDADNICVLARRGFDHVAAADGKVIQWRSTDGAATFGAASTVAGEEGVDCRDPAGGVVPVTGTGLLWICDATATPNDNHCYRTTDQGETWTLVHTHADGAADYVFGPLVIMPSGAIRQTFYNGSVVYCLESDDDGLTWSASISTALANCEPCMICVSGETDATAQLVMVWRQTGTNPLKMCSSVDGGATWTDNGALFVELQTQYDVSPMLYLDNTTLYLVYAARKHKRIVRYQADSRAVVNDASAWTGRTVLYRVDSNADADVGYPDMAKIGGVYRYVWYDTPYDYNGKPNIYITQTP